MAHLVVITHEYDGFLLRRPETGEEFSHYILYGVLKELEPMGHSWEVVRGLGPASGDAAILHVDCTFVDPEYQALAEAYPCAINFNAADISKRTVSGALLSRDSDWRGQVVIKSNLNMMGEVEARHNRSAKARDKPPPHPAAKAMSGYALIESAAAAPDHVWGDPDLVVERFVPETDAYGYGTRYWIFMGARERCTRNVSADWIVKGAGVLKREPVDVPDAIRAERARLGFDYGKFDFVIHEGEPILLDAARTPAAPWALREAIRAGARDLAEGLGDLVTGATATRGERP